MMWLITKLRTTAILGMVMSVLSPFLSDQLWNNVSSLAPAMAARAPATDLSKAASSSAREVALKGVMPVATSSDSVVIPVTAQLGISAMCDARRPAVIDFSCGLKPNLSSGTRSMTVRDVAISWSNSGIREALIAIFISSDVNLRCANWNQLYTAG